MTAHAIDRRSSAPPVHTLPLPLLIITPLIKGGIMAALLYALDVSFLKSLVIVIVSGFISGLFLLVSTVITLREARKSREQIRDVKRKLGADNRTTDE